MCQASRSITAHASPAYALSVDNSDSNFGPRIVTFFENEHLPVVFQTLCFKNEITNKKKKLVFYRIHLTKKRYFLKIFQFELKLLVDGVISISV